MTNDVKRFKKIYTQNKYIIQVKYKQNGKTKVRL